MARPNEKCCESLLPSPRRRISAPPPPLPPPPPPSSLFMILYFISNMIYFFCILLTHIFITQEAIFAMEGFDFGWSIGLVETMGVVGGSFLERSHSGNMCKRVAPLRSYLMLSGLLGASSLLSNVALKYIQYPTKVSC